ncbi:hypothetical protein JL720_12943 [Aureococcus anophagefferens]|nr:hypothetical protein JL720_12943 [Aureococcus anophagefferens]
MPMRRLLALSCLGLAAARPTVRELKNLAEFDKLLAHHAENTGLPVVVDFYSDSCGPCRMIAPVFKKLAAEYKDRAVFAKVNVAHARDVSSKAQIRSMPTFHFYADGRKKNEFSGAGEMQLRQATDQIVASAASANAKLARARSSQGLDDAAAAGREEGAVRGQGDDGGAPRGAREARRRRRRRRGRRREAMRTYLDEIAAEEDDEDDDEEDDEALPLYRPQSNFAERVVIVGGGPGGLGAAVYAAGLMPIAAAPGGGQLLGKGVTIENYPGVLGDTGPGIVTKMQQHAAESGAVFYPHAVTRVDLRRRPFVVETPEANISAHTLIVATGADSRWLGVAGESEFKGGGVSSCDAATASSTGTGTWP